eukprot:9208868-Pyramimonas_sp.AAC.1
MATAMLIPSSLFWTAAVIWSVICCSVMIDGPGAPDSAPQLAYLSAISLLMTHRDGSAQRSSSVGLAADVVAHEDVVAAM